MCDFGLDQIPRSTIEIEVRVQYPTASNARVRQMTIAIQSWLIGRAFEGRGLEAVRLTPGNLDRQEFTVLWSLATQYGRDRGRNQDRDRCCERVS